MNLWASKGAKCFLQVCFLEVCDCSGVLQTISCAMRQKGRKVHSNFSQLLTLRLALDFHI